MSELAIHPVAALFPMLADDELDELAADIKGARAFAADRSRCRGPRPRRAPKARRRITSQ
jgi:hypothetical protein